jgi:hypothetical protein
MNLSRMPETSSTTVLPIRGPGRLWYGIGIAESEERRHSASGGLPNSTGNAFPVIDRFSPYHSLNPPDT